MTREIRIPEPEGLNAELYREWQDSVLRIQRCASCLTLRHPPRFTCSNCGASTYDWATTPQIGSLYSWVITHHPFDRGWAAEVPWTSAIVELESGIRLTGHLINDDHTRLFLTMPVAISINPINEKFAFLSFQIIKGKQ